MTGVSLKGISRNRRRALRPLVATVQRYEELNPGVRISWEKRTLHEFGHASLASLAAAQYDVILQITPMMGDAALSLVSLAPLLGPGQTQRRNELYIGTSFASYEYRGTLYALPIDAAAPAASYRSDLLDRLALAVQPVGPTCFTLPAWPGSNTRPAGRSLPELDRPLCFQGPLPAPTIRNIFSTTSM